VPVFLTRELLPALRLRPQAKVVFISSSIARLPYPGLAIYGATKGFLSSFSESLACELHGTSVSVLCFHPGFTDTHFMPSAGMNMRRIPKMFVHTPETTAAGIVSAIRNDRPGSMQMSVRGSESSWQVSCLGQSKPDCSLISSGGYPMNKRAIAWTALILVVAFVGFSFWYTMMCEGSWDGIPLEAEHEGELGFLADSLRADVSYLSETLGPRNPAHYASLAATADWIQARWESQGYEVRRQAFMVDSRECANLEIEIPGKRYPSEIVILGAQYDTWPESPGANNNGSGVAVLLHVSVCSSKAQPDRTIRLVAFTTQEPPYDNTESMGSLRMRDAPASSTRISVLCSAWMPLAFTNRSLVPKGCPFRSRCSTR